MATTTPNYAWVVPTSSDLVAQGAVAIETLGDSADESLWNSGYGQAAKNKLINADFRINQRSFTSNAYTTATFDAFGFDRWKMNNAGDGTSTFSTQAFTLGAAPVAGYEGTNFLRMVTSGFTNAASRTDTVQSIESVRTFAGQTITVSFWAKAATGTPKIAVETQQNFGTGGSPSATNNKAVGTVTISTAWTRYSLTTTVDSISGKTLGTANNDHFNVRLWVNAGSDYATRASSIGIQNNTFDIWGVQAEYGSKATPFQTASGGSPQAELAMCQRYYWRSSSNASSTFQQYMWGMATSTGNVLVGLTMPTEMRVAPNAVDYANIEAADGVVGTTGGTLTINTNSSNTKTVSLNYAIALSFIQYRPYYLEAAGSAAAYIGFNAEL
jgi:hypothetical protein